MRKRLIGVTTLLSLLLVGSGVVHAAASYGVDGATTRETVVSSQVGEDRAFFSHKKKTISVFYKNPKSIPMSRYYEEYSGNANVGTYRGHLPLLKVNKTKTGYNAVYSGTISATYH